MRVALCTFAFPELVVSLARVLAGQCEVTVVLPERLQEVAQGVHRVRTFGFAPEQRSFQKLRGCAQLVARLREVNPDIVHFEGFSPWLVPFLPFFRRFPLITTLHDPVLHSGEENWAKNFSQWCLVRASGRVIVLSRVSRDLALKRFSGVEDKITVIPHGLYDIYTQGPERCPVGLSENEPFILFFGRVSPYKGVEYLLKAVKLLGAELQDYKVVLAGQHLYRVPIDASLSNRILVFDRFIENDELRYLFRRCHLVVLPYVEATQSGVLMLAYAFGRPVLATRVGSLPEMVVDGETGFLVEPKSATELADGIRCALSDRERLQRIGTKAGEIGKRDFSWQGIADSVLGLYRQLAFGEQQRKHSPNVVVAWDASHPPTRRIRLLILQRRTGPGGAEAIHWSLLTHLAGRCFEVTLCILEQYPFDGVARNRRELPADARVLSVRSPIALWTAWRLVFKLSPDIVLASGVSANLVARLFRSLNRVGRVVSLQHGIRIRGHALAQVLLRASRRWVDQYVAVSGASARFLAELEGIEPNAIRIIYNGIDLAPFQNFRDQALVRDSLSVPRDVPLGICVANFRPEKGHEVLLGALLHLQQRNVCCHMLLVGGGDGLPRIASLAQGLGLSRVQFLGPRNDVRDLLRATDFCVLPSLSEGLPCSLLEAMAARKPVIATHVGGIPEVITNGVNGVLVDPGRPDELAEAIENLLKDENKRRRLGEEGYRTVAERFSLPRMITQYEELLLSVVKEQAGGGAGR